MHILILPNSLKGSLSAAQAARILSTILGKKHQTRSFPLSDGGDGFIDFFRLLYPQAKTIRTQAHDAFLKPQKTLYLWLEENKTAVIETARICGLGNAKKEELDILHASSFGVGEVILKAVKRGAKKIYIGLGGVACHDGGTGLAQALGAIFSDKQGRMLPPGPAQLSRLNKIDLQLLKQNLRGVEIVAVADVTNPMLGPQGSARVFGPQKGATPAQVRTLEKALKVYARTVKKQTGKELAYIPSTAAAGAIGAGLYGLTDAKLILGAHFLQAHLPLEKWVRQADLVITSEGKLDSQTLYGKAPLAALHTAAKYKKPVLFICGSYEEKALKKLPKNLALQIICLADFAKNTQDSIQNAAKYIKQIARKIS